VNKAEMPEFKVGPIGHICPIGDIPHDKQYCQDRIQELDDAIHHMSLTISYLYDYKRLLEKELKNMS